MSAESWIRGQHGGCPVVHNVTDPQVISQPWPWYRALRLQAPLAYSPELGGYLVTRHETVQEVLSEPGKIFRSAALNVRLPSVFNSDGPDHVRYRRAAVEHFKSRDVRALEPMIRDYIDQLIDDLPDTGEVDLMRAVARPLPLHVICQLLGVPDESSGQFESWVQATFEALGSGLGNAQDEPGEAFAEVTELGLFFSGLMEHRRQHPGDDIVSRMVNAESSDLDDYETLLLIISLAFGGHITTTSLIADGLRLGLEHPQTWAQAAADGDWSGYLDEVLRYEAPVHTVARLTMAPVELEGVLLPAGTKVFTYMGSANRDADIFADPDTFRPDRAANLHLAFGAGPHTCMGRTLAQLEGRIVFEAMAEVLPRYRPVPGRATLAQASGRRVMGQLWATRAEDAAPRPRRIVPGQVSRAGHTLKAVAKLAGPGGTRRLADELAELRGVVLKIGQMLSFLDLPGSESYATAFDRLRSQASPRPYRSLAPLIAHLGEAGSRLEIDERACAAASIGQVHPGLLDGAERVAVKVQYPDAAGNVVADLRNGLVVSRFTTAMARLLGLPAAALDLQSMVEELRGRMTEELDYRLEASRQAQFRAIFAGDPAILVPQVYPEIGDDRVLVTGWCDGIDWNAAKSAPQELRDQWAGTIFRFVFSSLYRHGVFNADPHPGNYIFRDDGSVGFVDFGCVKEFGGVQLSALRGLYRAMLADDIGAAAAALGQLGVAVPESSLGPWLSVLYRPLTAQQPFQYDPGYGRALFDAYMTLLRDTEGDTVTMPASLTLMNRINLGVHSVLCGLGASGDWRQRLDDILAGTQVGGVSPTGQAHG